MADEPKPNVGRIVHNALLDALRISQGDAPYGPCSPDGPDEITAAIELWDRLTGV